MCSVVDFQRKEEETKAEKKIEKKMAHKAKTGISLLNWKYQISARIVVFLCSLYLSSLSVSLSYIGIPVKDDIRRMARTDERPNAHKKQEHEAKTKIQKELNLAKRHFRHRMN